MVMFVIHDVLLPVAPGVAVTVLLIVEKYGEQVSHTDDTEEMVNM